MTLRRVLIDGYFLGKPYGFGRFVSELCRALGSAPTDIQFVVAVPARIDPRTLPAYRNFIWHTLPNVNFVVWEQVLIPWLAHRSGCGVVHFPYNTRALLTPGVRTVTTVHDVFFLTESIPVRKFRSWFSIQYARRIFSLATHKSDAVVSVSDTTRRALAPMGIEATTVYNTVDGFLAELPRRRKAVDRPYILHRGGYQPHRNTERLIQAFRIVRTMLPDMELKIVGTPESADRWGTRDDEGIQYLPRLSDAELAACYAGSLCVVVASLSEGFGLPIIEGFGFGTPVITSDIDPMREVAGNAAFLVDPYNIEALAEAMRSVVSDRLLAARLIEKGRARLAAFSGSRVAEQMMKIYATCLEPTARASELQTSSL